MTDEALCEKLKKGSQAALDEAIRRFTPYVSTVVWRVFVSSSATKEDLEEVVADTFLSLWNHAEEVEPGKIRAWLATVAKNRAIDRLRARFSCDELTENDVDPTPGPESVAIQREYARLLWDCVNALGEPDRSLFIRHFFEGEKLNKVASDLNMNAGTARTRLHRGKKRLREFMAKEGVEFEAESGQAVERSY